MRLAAVRNKITSKVGRQALIVQKNSPALLFGAGVVGVATTVVLACRATLKVEDVLKEAEAKGAQIEQAEVLESEKYKPEDAKKDRLTVRVQTGIKIARLYAPAIVVGTLTVGALTGSHVILSRRNVALSAAYGALQKGFQEYRQRVVDEFGEEKDAEFRFGTVEREIAVDTDEGVAVKTVKGAAAGNGRSIYARVFDEGNPNWAKRSSYNQMFIRCQQNYANDLLNARGHLFLNEVYDMLGFDRTAAGQVVGWVKGNGDSFVDFGVFRGDMYEAQRFVNGDERSVWLDFNVDGVVYDLIGERA